MVGKLSYRDGDTKTQERLVSELPASLKPLADGCSVPADPQNKTDFSPPPWLDMQKFKLGQKFALENIAGITFAEMTSLLLIFSIERALDALIFTTKSSSPLSAFQRYNSTAKRLHTWYSEDVWDPSSGAGRNISAVRAMHRSVKNRMDSGDPQQVEQQSKISHPCCPHLTKIKSDFRAGIAPSSLPSLINLFGKFSYINQTAMASTQFSFMGLAILYPDKFGIQYKSEEELEAFVHMWAGIGYLLGTDDRYNFCLGSLAECRQRTSDFIATWAKTSLRKVGPDWEHMSRCLCQGLSYSAPEINFEACLCYVCWVIGVPLPTYYSSVSWSSRLKFYVYRLVFTVLFYIPGYRARQNYTYNNRVKRGSTITPEKTEQLRIKSDQYLRRHRN